MSVQTRLALVTGANRGIGREVCRQLGAHGFTVLLGSRELIKGEMTVQQLGAAPVAIEAVSLDVTNPQSVEQLRDSVAARFGALNVLVNNAAILYDTWQQACNADLAAMQQALDTNLLGAWRIATAFLPLLRRSAHGRIVNVSSEAGSLAGTGGGTPAYSVSKAVCNALTRMLADELRRDHLLVNSVCPGWVATDMGGAGGRWPRARQAWSGQRCCPTTARPGGFFRDGRPLPW